MLLFDVKTKWQLFFFLNLPLNETITCLAHFPLEGD